LDHPFVHPFHHFGLTGHQINGDETQGKKIKGRIIVLQHGDERKMFLFLKNQATEQKTSSFSMVR
jgi:hypothetical protein